MPLANPLPSSAQAKVAAAVVAEPKQPHEIEMEKKLALLQKVRVNREASRNMRKVTGGNPAKQYVWINIHEQRQQYFQGLGYVMCKDPSVQTSWKRADSTHQCGDLILYEIDKDLHEAYKLDSALRGVESMEGSQEEFLAFAERNRVPVQKK